MNIGILTFHRTQNYGAVLQAYALKEAIQQFGHHVEIIDYRPEFLVERYLVFDKKRISSSSFIKLIMNLIKEISLLSRRYIKRKKFLAFYQDSLNLSVMAYKDGVECNIVGYDIIVVGSDQVWNTKITKGFNPMFWGLFNRS